MVLKVCNEGGNRLQVVVDLRQRDAEQDRGDIFLTDISLDRWMGRELALAMMFL